MTKNIKSSSFASLKNRASTPTIKKFKILSTIAQRRRSDGKNIMKVERKYVMQGTNQCWRAQIYWKEGANQLNRAQINVVGNKYLGKRAQINSQIRVDDENDQHV